VVWTAVGSGPTSIPQSEYRYAFYVDSGSGFVMVQDFGIGSTWTMPASMPAGTYSVAVWVRTNAAPTYDAVAYSWNYWVKNPPATGVTLTPDATSPQPAGTAIVWTAVGSGPAGIPQSDYRYGFYLDDGTGFILVQDFGIGSTWTMPANTPPGTYNVAVWVRTNAVATFDAVAYVWTFIVQ
jgi:hypothetical protein